MKGFIYRSCLLLLMLLTTSLVWGQNLKNIKGRVFDEKGQGYPGVQVMVKDSVQLTTITDMDGYFMLAIPERAILQISMMGNQNEYVQTGEEDLVPIMLSNDTEKRMFTWYWCCTSHPDSLHCAKSKNTLRKYHGSDEKYIRKR